MLFASNSATTKLRPLRHAVVLGGSIAGLMAARVLSDHFERVTLIERDALGPPEPRRGVPQGNHLHAFLVRGRLIAEAMMPGLSEKLQRAGAALIDSGREFAWYHAGAWRAPYDGDLAVLSMSRPLLESGIAERVGALPNVTLRDRLRVVGVLDQGGRISGVRVAPKGQAQTSDVEADLVVDATGRGSATPQWLPKLGFAAPDAQLCGASITYATCTFPRPDQGKGWRALVVTGQPLRRTGIIFPVEGDRWLVTLAGFFDEPMPQGHDAFLAFARRLPVPDIHDAIRHLEPQSPITRYRFAGSLRRRYERLKRFPEGLIAIGDAVCSFNPVYGQGMTVSALEAEALGHSLDRAKRQGGIDPDFGQRWFRTLKPIVDLAWNGARLEDLRFPELRGQRPLHLRPAQWYMERVHRATHRSALVTDQFYRVVNFLDPPRRLFRPRVACEVLLGNLAGPRRLPADEAGLCRSETRAAR